MADEKLEILITADDKASSVFRSLSGVFGNVFSTAAGFLSAQVFSRLGTELVTLAGDALNATVEWERLGFTIESMVARELRASDSTLTMGDALDQASGRSQELLDWIQKLAIQSPFSTTSVANTFSQALAYGFTSEEAQGLTTNLLDLAAATGRTEAQLGQIGYALGQINASDKLLMQDVRQLINAGVDVTAILGEMGYTLGDVGEKAISSADFIAAFNKVSERDYSSSVDRMKNSWAGLLGALTDVKDIGLRYVFEGIFENLQPVVSLFTDWMLGPGLVKLQEMGANLGNMIAPFTDLAMAFMQGGTGSAEFGAALDVLLDKLGPLGDLIRSVTSGEGGGLGAMFSAFSALMPLFTGLGGILMQSLLPAIGQIASMLSPLISAFVPQLVEMFGSLAVILVQSLLPPFMTLIQAILPPLMALISPLIDLFGQLVVALMPIVEVILGALADLITRVMEALMPVINAILPVLVELFITVADAISPLLDAILPPLIDIVMMLIDAILPLVSAILPLLANLFQVVILAIAPLLEAILPVLVKLIELLLTALNPVIEIALPAFAKLVEGLSDSIERYILPALRNFSTWMSEHVTPAINGIISAIQSAIDWVKEMAASLSNITLPDWLTPGSPTPFEIGLRGIASALKDVNDVAFPSLGGVTAPFTGDAALGSSGRSSSASTGPTIILQYSPTFSFASEAEARDKLIPFVQEGIRRAKQDGLL